MGGILPVRPYEHEAPAAGLEPAPPPSEGRSREPPGPGRPSLHRDDISNRTQDARGQSTATANVAIMIPANALIDSKRVSGTPTRAIAASTYRCQPRPGRQQAPGPVENPGPESARRPPSPRAPPVDQQLQQLVDLKSPSAHPSPERAPVGQPHRPTLNAVLLRRGPRDSVRVEQPPAGNTSLPGA